MSERNNSAERGQNEIVSYLSAQIGNNLIFWLCCSVPVIAIMLIWVDTSLPKLGWTLLGEGLPVVFLMIISERLTVIVGAKNGKTDKRYLDARTKYENEKERVVSKCGRMRAPAFCAWYIDHEYSEEFARRLRKLRLSKEEFESLKAEKILKRLRALGTKRLIEFQMLLRMDYINLTPDMLFDEESVNKERGLGQSGEEKVHEKTWGLKGIIISLVSAACTISIALSLTKDPSWIRVLYTIAKVFAILYRMARGLNDGTEAYTRTEVKHKDQQTKFLGLYDEFCNMEEKKGADKISVNEVPRELGNPNHEGTGASPTDRELHAVAGADL